MRIVELLKTKSPAYSFEFFPPKTDEDIAHLLETARKLKNLAPAYISVTWGAGGSTRRKTLDIVSAIKTDVGIESMAHLTCVGSGRADIDSALDEIERRNIDNVLALRGDPPRGTVDFVPHPDGFRYASELVRHIRKSRPLCLGVAGYPEKHIESSSVEADLDHLKAKVDAGADFVITQLFFNNADFFRFRDKAQARGIAVPLIPGIMPVTNVNQLKRFTTLCGATIPPAFLARLEAAGEDLDAVVRLGVEHATAQCRDLLKAGVPGIHFYTLNRSHSTAQILQALRS